MRIANRIYRLALLAYPPAFRLRYREEMTRVFDEGLRDARAKGVHSAVRYCGTALGDLLASVMREHVTATNRVAAGAGLFAILAGGAAAYVDFHATEVQATLLVLIAMNFVLGWAAPKKAWHRALIVAIILPAVHVAAYALGRVDANHGHPYVSRLMIFFPAFLASVLGAYAGVLLNIVGRRLAGPFKRHRGPGSGTTV